MTKKEFEKTVLFNKKYVTILHSKLLKFETSNEEDREDIIAETFLSAWKSFHTFNQEKKMMPWLCKIVQNKAIDKYRVKYLNARNNQEMFTFPIKPEYDTFELQDAINNSVGKLPLKIRNCWLAYETLGLSYKNIAKKYKCNINTVKGYVRKARIQLRKSLVKFRN